MIALLALAVTVFSLGSGAIVAGQVARGTYRWVRTVPTLALVQLALVGQAVIDVVALAAGHRPGEFATHLAYLATSVVVLPVAAAQSARDDGRWSGVLLAGALVVVAVLVIRMQATWRVTHA